MWRLIKFAFDLLTGVAWIVGVFFLPRDLSEAGEALSDWERVLTAIDREAFLIVVSGILLLRLLWVDLKPYVFEHWPRHRQLQEFEKPDGWSLSFRAGNRIGPNFWRPPHPRTLPGGTVIRDEEGEKTIATSIRVDGVWFSNLSQSRTRVVNVLLRVKDWPGLEDFESEPSKYPRAKRDTLTFPLKIPPKEHVEGSIEFQIPHKLLDKISNDAFFVWDFEAAEFVCDETVAGDFRQVYFGEEFDAYTNKVRVKRSADTRAERLALRGIVTKTQQ